MRIQSKIKEYSFELCEDALNSKERIFAGFKFNRPFYFIDQNFHELYKEKLDAFVSEDFSLVIAADERNKSYLKIAEYYQSLIEAGFTRNDCLVTLGGGILQDISGFIASTLYRGLKWIFLPTTLLAQADSCIGSKTSINFGDSKNLIGTFYPPDRIFIDLKFNATLTDEYFNSGLGEIIKFHLLASQDKYRQLQEYLASSDLRTSALFPAIVQSTLEIKKSFFDEDEFDTGRRNLLNYGHCFGHALESASDFSVCHGEAVLAGMGFANLVSRQRGTLSQKVYDELEEILKNYYPRFDLGAISVDSIIDFMKRDKKRIGKDLTMILTCDVGNHIKVHDVTEDEVRNTFKEFMKIYPSKPVEYSTIKV